MFRGRLELGWFGVRLRVWSARCNNVEGGLDGKEILLEISEMGLNVSEPSLKLRVVLAICNKNLKVVSSLLMNCRRLNSAVDVVAEEENPLSPSSTRKEPEMKVLRYAARVYFDVE